MAAERTPHQVTTRDFLIAMLVVSSTIVVFTRLDQVEQLMPAVMDWPVQASLMLTIATAALISVLRLFVPISRLLQGENLVWLLLILALVCVIGLFIPAVGRIR